MADGTRSVIETCMQNTDTISKPSPIKKGKNISGYVGKSMTRVIDAAKPKQQPKVEGRVLPSDNNLGLSVQFVKDHGVRQVETLALISSIARVGHVRRRVTTSTRRSAVASRRTLITTISASAPWHATLTRHLIALRRHTGTTKTTRRLIAITTRACSAHGRLMARWITRHWMSGRCGRRSTLRCHGAPVLRETIGRSRSTVTRSWRLRWRVALIELASWRTVFAPLLIGG